jgi:Ribosomal subunit 39S
MKRTMQLTGLRIPDAAIMPAKTVKALLAHLIKPPKPRKLVEALEQKEELMNLPNVSIYAKRITPIDKHKSVGRWKVIEKELMERGLPVTGHEKEDHAQWR